MPKLFFTFCWLSAKQQNFFPKGPNLCKTLPLLKHLS